MRINLQDTIWVVGRSGNVTKSTLESLVFDYTDGSIDDIIAILTTEQDYDDYVHGMEEKKKILADLASLNIDELKQVQTIMDDLKLSEVK